MLCCVHVEKASKNVKGTTFCQLKFSLKTDFDHIFITLLWHWAIGAPKSDMY